MVDGVGMQHACAHWHAQQAIIGLRCLLALLEEGLFSMRSRSDMQLLAGSVSFRDESSPDEEAAYAAASQACMEMWKRHMPTGVRKTGKHDA